MCILFLEYRPEDDGFPYSLVAACNRDAYFNKDTAPANFWDDNDDILAGKNDAQKIYATLLTFDFFHHPLPQKFSRQRSGEDGHVVWCLQKRPFWCCNHSP